MESELKVKKSPRGGARVGAGRKKVDVLKPKARKTEDLTLSIPIILKEKMEAKYPYKISKLTTKFYELLISEDEKVKFFNDYLNKNP
jgi:hypothetical protein